MVVMVVVSVSKSSNTARMEHAGRSMPDGAFSQLPNV